MSEDLIKLSAVVGGDGVIKLVDQDGRRLGGVRAVSVSAEFCGEQDVTEATITVIVYDEHGKPICNNKPNK